MINKQIDTECESSASFYDDFAKIMCASSIYSKSSLNNLKVDWIDTPLGIMIAIADDEALYLLEFIDRWRLEFKIIRLQKKTKSTIIPGYCNPILSIKKELAAYFAGDLKEFKTKLQILGSNFQKSAWKALMGVPYGATCSYLEQAKIIGKASACRAVANANAANQIAIVLPCHRIINTSGRLGGYAGGLQRKEWLINHEKKYYYFCP